jgi:predicted transcriptional regulator
MKTTRQKNPLATAAKVIELLEKGIKASDISKIVGISQNSISRFIGKKREKKAEPQPQKKRIG